MEVEEIDRIVIYADKYAFNTKQYEDGVSIDTRQRERDSWTLCKQFPNLVSMRTVVYCESNDTRARYVRVSMNCRSWGILYLAEVEVYRGKHLVHVPIIFVSCNVM